MIEHSRKKRRLPAWGRVRRAWGKGDVVSFVTPTPDLNLKPYVGRRIGVNGTRGFMTEFRRAHVTAGRVTPIDAPLRR